MSELRVDTITDLAGTGPASLPNGIITTNNSFVQVIGADGQTGSTDTNVRRLHSTNVVSNGSDITYSSTAANGSTFTINTDGLYVISYQDSDFNSSLTAAVSINSTSAPASLTPAETFAYTRTEGGTEQVINIDGARFLSAGDVIRAVVDNSSGLETVNDLVGFIITKVG